MNEEYLEVHMPPPNYAKKEKQPSAIQNSKDSDLVRDEDEEKAKSGSQANSNKSSKDENGYKIGQYLITKTLGEGTFGKVKLGKHILTG
jgi:hypothetical protein